MKTRNRIKVSCRELFNTHGVMNVTFRDVAKELGKSYGNLTYHFENKEQVVLELYHDLNAELSELRPPGPNDNLLTYFLSLPGLSYSIELDYLFFILDYVEIKRNFPKVFAEMEQMVVDRKSKWMLLLTALQQQGFLQSDLSEPTLQDLMFLSGSVRAAYFQTHHPSAYSQQEYHRLVNQLLRPYLSTKGQEAFEGFVG